VKTVRRFLDLGEDAEISAFRKRLKAKDSKLTAKEEDLLKTFKTLCEKDQRETFSSDTFRNYQLDKCLRDTMHGIGGLFAIWKKLGYIEQVGMTRSQLKKNNLREIKLYKFKGEAKEE